MDVPYVDENDPGGEAYYDDGHDWAGFGDGSGYADPPESGGDGEEVELEAAFGADAEYSAAQEAVLSHARLLVADGHGRHPPVPIQLLVDATLLPEASPSAAYMGSPDLHLHLVRLVRSIAAEASRSAADFSRGGPRVASLLKAAEKLRSQLAAAERRSSDKFLVKALRKAQQERDESDRIVATLKAELAKRGAMLGPEVDKLIDKKVLLQAPHAPGASREVRPPRGGGGGCSASFRGLLSVALFLLLFCRPRISKRRPPPSPLPLS